MKKSILVIGITLLSVLGYGQVRSSKTISEEKFNTNKITIKQDFVDGQKDGDISLCWSAVSASPNYYAEEVYLNFTKDEALALAESLINITTNGEKGSKIQNRDYTITIGSGIQNVNFIDNRHFEAFKMLRKKDALAIAEFINSQIK